MTGGQLTSRVSRLGHVAEISRAFARACADHGVTQAQVSEACGRPTTIVQRWADHERPECPTLADVALMPTAVAVDLLRAIASQHDHLVAPAPQAGDSGCDLELLARTVSECGGASSAFAHAISDGTITPDQARDCEREADEAIAALCTLRARARGVTESRDGKVRRLRREA